MDNSFGTGTLFVFLGANRTLGFVGNPAVLVSSSATRLWRRDVMTVTTAKRAFRPLMYPARLFRPHG